MRTLAITAAALVVAFWFGTCAGHYANQRAENNPFEKRIAIQEVQQ
jgi:hypothetical protein